jgi:hypothetical protein
MVILGLYQQKLILCKACLIIKKNVFLKISHSTQNLDSRLSKLVILEIYKPKLFNIYLKIHTVTQSLKRWYKLDPILALQQDKN